VEIYKSKTYKKDQLYGVGGSNNFIPAFDYSDHFQFVCSKCKDLATVLRVGIYGDNSNKCIEFLLECPTCGTHGVRKIYLDDSYPNHLIQYPVKAEPLSEVKDEAKGNSN
jgi:hypothetical protein